MDNKIVRIPSKLYAELFFAGGDKLLSVYSILKASREGEVKYYSYISKNNKKLSGFNLLRNKTSLTLHSIKKYVPLLINLGLCFIDVNGDFVLLGNDKLKDKYNNKLVPLKIGKNLTDTCYNVYIVRGFAMEKSQTKQINRKLTQREQIAQISNPKTLADYKAAKRLLKSQGAESTEIIEKTVLSLQGFGVLKHTEDNTIRDIKSSGAYYKRKLVEKGLIKTKREFKRLEKMSYSEFLNRKEFGDLTRKHIYKKGWLVEETVSSFTTVSAVKEFLPAAIEKTEVKETAVTNLLNSCNNYKRKEYLQFDMIDFWVNKQDVQ